MTGTQRAPAVELAIKRLTRTASGFAEHIDRDGVGMSTVRLSDLGLVLGELANPTAPDVSGAVSIPCAMSGPLEMLTVYPVGKRGVTFRYGDEASVIVDGDELLKIRAIIDQQIGQPAVAPPPPDIGGESPSVREAGVREAAALVQSKADMARRRAAQLRPDGVIRGIVEASAEQLDGLAQDILALLTTTAEGGADG